MSEKRVLDVLTDRELEQIQELKRCILKSSTNFEIRYFRRKIDDIIKKAKTRHFQERKQEQTV